MVSFQMPLTKILNMTKTFDRGVLLKDQKKKKKLLDPGAYLREITYLLVKSLFLHFSRSSITTVVFTIGQNPKQSYAKFELRFLIFGSHFLPVRVYVIVQELSTMIVRKRN